MSDTQAMTSAVILAAGMSRRLQEVWPAAPKGLLTIGDQPIIERSVTQLLAHGMEQIILVTGYHAAQYQPLIQRYPALRPVYNPHYATSGSMYSLACAHELLTTDFLLLESDLIYEDRALSALLSCPAPAAILVSGPTNAGDEVYVEVAEDRVTRISKQHNPLVHLGGEMVGISKISRPLWKAMHSYATTYFAQKDRYLEYCSGCLNVLAAQYPIACCPVADLIWAEIDDAAQWQRVQTRIGPQLMQV